MWSLPTLVVRTRVGPLCPTSDRIGYNSVMPLLPLVTRRLTIRVMRPTDADVLTGYRNDPTIARHQSWPLPYPVDQARRMLSEQSTLDDLDPDGWTQLAIDLDGVMIGDLAVGLSDDGRVAQVGYTVARAFQGAGHASEALSALVDALFRDTTVQRITASLDPRNLASLRVLEQQGFLYEGCERDAAVIRGEVVDDLRYALLRRDREAWTARPAEYGSIELVALGPETVRAFSRLATHRSQERFVAPMWASFRDALFPEVIDGAPVVPWMRGIVADGEPVGFVMLADVTDAHPDPYLWRLLVDRMHQRRGIGSAVIAMIADQMRRQGCTRLLTSWVDGPGGPRPFYERLGFEPTGTVIDGEIEGELDLRQPSGEAGTPNRPAVGPTP